jgi:hypothetical protein
LGRGANFPQARAPFSPYPPEGTKWRGGKGRGQFSPKGEGRGPDLETRTIEGVMSCYCVSIYDGVNISSFYLTDFKNPEEMLESAIVSLMLKKYHGYRLYLHNFSNFDGVFLLRILTKLNDTISPLIKNCQ